MEERRRRYGRDKNVRDEGAIEITRCYILETFLNTQM
jgi:hypothetical protein